MAERVLHPVRVVTQRTGLSPDLLRAWERRYSLVRPTRSAGGQRLYSDDDIEHLRLIHKAVLSGRSISQVAPLDHRSLAELVAADSSGIASEPVPDDDGPLLSRALAECRTAVERIDGPALERALKRAAHRFSVPVLLDHLLLPLLREIGDRWEQGELLPIHEHAASVEIHRLLTWIVVSTPVADDAPLIAVATPAGQHMELGALMVAATAAAEGWRIAWFGPNLPAADIIHGVESRRPAAVAISLVHQTRESTLHRELQEIAEGVSGKAVLLVGGRAAPPYALMMERMGAIVMQDLSALRHWLRNHAPRAGGQ